MMMEYYFGIWSIRAALFVFGARRQKLVDALFEAADQQPLHRRDFYLLIVKDACR